MNLRYTKKSAGLRQLTLADMDFYLKYKWRNKLWQSLSGREINMSNNYALVRLKMVLALEIFWLILTSYMFRGSYVHQNKNQTNPHILAAKKNVTKIYIGCCYGSPFGMDFTFDITTGTQLSKICAKENIEINPIVGACAIVAALSTSDLETNKFIFVKFIPKHSETKKERLMVSSNETRTLILYVLHILSQFLEETTPYIIESRSSHMPCPDIIVCKFEFSLICKFLLGFCRLLS